LNDGTDSRSLPNRKVIQEKPMTWMEWYDNLAKPSWTPSPSTISRIWTILYLVIVASFGFVFLQAFQGKIPRRIAVPFAINLVANLVFMPIFAGLHNVPLACLDIVIVWATIIWCVVAIWPLHRWVALAQGPYFIWVSIASALQLSITAMNWGRW
jgi:translocator protein